MGQNTNCHNRLIQYNIGKEKTYNYINQKEARPRKGESSADSASLQAGIHQEICCVDTGSHPHYHQIFSIQKYHSIQPQNTSEYKYVDLSVK